MFTSWFLTRANHFCPVWCWKFISMCHVVPPTSCLCLSFPTFLPCVIRSLALKTFLFVGSSVFIPWLYDLSSIYVQFSLVVCLFINHGLDSGDFFLELSLLSFCCSTCLPPCLRLDPFMMCWRWIKTMFKTSDSFCQHVRGFFTDGGFGSFFLHIKKKKKNQRKNTFSTCFKE